MVKIDNRKLVFRFYSTGKETALREHGILKFLVNQGVKAPTVIDSFEIEGKAVVVLEFIEGSLLENHLLKTKHPNLNLFHHIGTVLAKIHNIGFSQTGFIGPDMKIGNQYQNFSLFLEQFIAKTLREVSAERLDPEVRDRLLTLIADKWHLVLATEPASHLVHCDFNPKNIMVNDNRVAAVLDWEFCLSGNGYIDMGNFFRFAYDYPEGAQEAFITGYKSLRRINENWLVVAKLLDLGNMCSFLERPEYYQKTFRTARAVMNSTLEYFAY